MDQSKTCTSCGANKPLSAYYRNRTKPDGRQSRCRECTMRSRGYSPVGARKHSPPAYRDGHGKTCPRCSSYQPWSSFGANRSTRDGVQAYCRPCASRLTLISQERNAEALAARHAEKLARQADSKRTKVCRRCGDEKPQLEFYAHRSNGDGRASNCRTCAQELARQYRAERREQQRAYNEKRKLDPAKVARAKRNQRSIWLRNYGLTVDSHTALLLKQEGVCAICRQPGQNWAERNLNVDHDHASLQVRGLLCGRCNLGLGYFKDAPGLLAAAIDYLKNPPALTE